MAFVTCHFYKTLGRILRRERRKQHITQKELSRFLKVDQTTLCLWEHGKRKIPLLTYLKLAKRLNISWGFFMPKEWEN